MIDGEPEKSPTGYWVRRKDLLYYQCVATMVTGFAPRRARSIVDVGSNRTSLLEEFDFFRRRVSIDLRRPYRSSKVKGLKRDFLVWEPKRRFNVALCLQVLEHVPDPRAFALKLFAIAEDVIISVPYMWPEKSSPGHIHDLLDERALESWTDRKPTHSVVVQEPLMALAKSRRLVAYYQHPSRPFSFADANKALKAREAPLQPIAAANQ
jgi:hypothetical protein